MCLEWIETSLVIICLLVWCYMIPADWNDIYIYMILYNSYGRLYHKLVSHLVFCCGWLQKSCTTCMVETCWNPINNGINHLSTGAGFRDHRICSGRGIVGSPAVILKLVDPACPWSCHWTQKPMDLPKWELSVRNRGAMVPWKFNGLSWSRRRGHQKLHNMGYTHVYHHFWTNTPTVYGS